MRILMYSESLRREGGTEISSYQVARALWRRGHAIDLLYGNDGEIRPEYASFCRTVTRARTNIGQARPRDALSLIPAIGMGVIRHPDVIYVHRFRDVVCARLTGTMARAPVVCHLRDMFHDWTAPRLKNWANRFIAVSSATRDSWIESGLDPERIAVVHQGIDPSLYPAGDEEDRARARGRLGLPADAFVALYYGRLDVDKGIDVLLDAWRRLGMPVDKGRLVLKGRPVLATDPDAYLHELRSQAPPGCTWLPMADDVLTALHAADVVVLASVTEGLGRVALEGMASGRPVVATRVGGLPEILTGPFERFLFASGDSVALAERLSSVADWRRREPQLGAACAAHINTHFSIDTMAQQIEGVLDGEVRARHHGRANAPSVPADLPVAHEPHAAVSPHR